jgi:hypothetical protein
MPHIKVFGDPPYTKDPNIDRQLPIDKISNLLKINLPTALLANKLLSNLQFKRNSINKRMDLLIRPGRPRPINPLQLILIALQYESPLAQHFMDYVLDGVFGGTLVLHAEEGLAVVTEENAAFCFEGFWLP